eukprot:4784588-Pleurochrysis_carterae.AAC.1
MSRLCPRTICNKTQPYACLYDCLNIHNELSTPSPVSSHSECFQMLINKLRRNITRARQYVDVRNSSLGART